MATVRGSDDQPLRYSDGSRIYIETGEPVIPPLPPINPTAYYAAPNGSPANDGTLASPWTLTHALTKVSPGDTIYLRGGKYRSTVGYTPSKPGFDDTYMITITPYDNEVPILDGFEPSFVDNPAAAWVVHDAARSIYRSVATFPSASGTIYYGGFIPLGVDEDDHDGWYPLVPHKSYEALSSDVHNYQYPDPYYVGPGTWFDKTGTGSIFIRLVNSTEEAQCGRNVIQIADPDPRNHVVLLSRKNTYGFDVNVPFFKIDGDPQIVTNGITPMDAGGIVPGTGLIIQGYDALYRVGVAAAESFKAINVEGHFNYHVMRTGYGVHAQLLGGYYDGHMDPDTWWVSWIDVKGGALMADYVRKCFVDLGASTSLEVGPSPGTGDTSWFPVSDGAVPILVKGCFDMFLGDGWGTEALPVKIHGVYSTNVWDDYWQMKCNIHHVDTFDCWMEGGGISRDSGKSTVPNDAPDTIWYHHCRLVGQAIFYYRFGRSEDPLGIGYREVGGCLSTHGSPSTPDRHSLPINIYNCDLYRGHTGYEHRQAFLNFQRFGGIGAELIGVDRRFNNILVSALGSPLGRDTWVTDGGEIYDGNLYWGWANPSPSGYSSIWRLMHLSTGTVNGENPDGSIGTVDLIRSLSAVDSQVYYLPGWEDSGVQLDPLPDADWNPTVDVHAGALDLEVMFPDWPGVTAYVPHRGAIGA